ncbi:MAG: DUF2911 domain-containing protein [Flavobacteriales bacterium]|nr:DUF2911 domain-containing protein [Flavobacteriales bacterium]
MKYSMMFAATLVALQAIAQDLPKPSPLGEVEQIVGLTEVEFKYSRPSAKERKVYGELVPFGELWRTGANQCTVMEIDGPVVIAGSTVPEGKYCLFTIPNVDAWTMVLNRNTDLWGTDDYQQEQDVLRWEVKPSKIPFRETLTISFDAVKEDKARVDIDWEETRASFEIFADASDKAMANIKEAVAKEDADFRVFNNSARYCIDKGIMAEQALEWATKSVSLEKKFWNVHTLALAHAANGQYKEAMKTAEESMKMAQEADYQPYVKMNKEKMDEWTLKTGR